MRIIQANLKKFSGDTLTSFFYSCQPTLILFKGNVIRLICYHKPINFISWKELKSLSIEGWQVANFEIKNSNYYVCGWNKSN